VCGGDDEAAGVGSMWRPVTGNWCCPGGTAQARRLVGIGGKTGYAGGPSAAVWCIWR